jgi:N-dimethylarginine dimethylaminohydrolase
MLAVRPDGFSIPSSQNVFTVAKTKVNKPKAIRQHAALCREVGAHVAVPPPETLPDLVFTANAGLHLPRLPHSTVLLSNMKHASRAKETPFIETYLNERGIKTVRCPKQEPFEGQGEGKWFYEGKLLLVGYGYRSTKATIPMLQRALNRIYRAHDVVPPKVVGVELASPDMYHLDIAMSAFSPAACIAHPHAFKHPKELEKWVQVHWIHTNDPFVLNMKVLNDRIVTHKLLYEKDKKWLERVTQRKVVEIDVREFEKSGGAVRCMLLDLDQR